MLNSGQRKCAAQPYRLPDSGFWASGLDDSLNPSDPFSRMLLQQGMCVQGNYYPKHQIDAQLPDRSASANFSQPLDKVYSVQRKIATLIASNQTKKSRLAGKTLPDRFFGSPGLQVGGWAGLDLPVFSLWRPNPI
jgi:hypothetical protein